MHSDEEDSGYSERDRAPGKLDQHVLDNLVQLSEANYSKSPTKGSCYAPTALLEAKKREVEAPMEEQQQQFRYDSIPRSGMYLFIEVTSLILNQFITTCFIHSEDVFDEMHTMV